MQYVSDFDKLVLPCADTQLFSVLNSAHPVGFRMVVVEVVIMGVGQLVENAAGQDGLGVCSVSTGHVKGDGVEGAEHTHVRDDGHIVFGVAVTVGGDVHDEADMEVGAILHYCQSVLGDLAVEDVVGLVIGGGDSVHGANADASAAADALIIVDGGLFVSDSDGTVGAVSGAGAAADAVFLMDNGLTGGVHLHLAGSGATAHAKVLESAAEAGGLMALEVVHGDNDVCIHNGAAYLGFLHILTVNGNEHFVSALQTVGNDDMGAGGEGVVAILIGF